MNCPYCHKDNNYILDTRYDKKGNYKRIRKCTICGRKFRTYECYYESLEQRKDGRINGWSKINERIKGVRKLDKNEG